MNNGLTAEQLISKARVSLMNNPEWAWMASVMMMGETSFVGDDVTPTACTDGYNERYNSKWIQSLSLPQIMFVVLHENYHKLFRHLYVWQNLWEENPMLANAACDIVINTQYLYGKANITYVDNGTVMKEYADPNKWNVKDVYNDLKKRMQQNPSKAPKGHDQHDWENAKKQTTQEVEKIGKEIDAAIRQASLAGSLAGGIPRSIKSMLAPPLDWRALMSEFVKASCSGLDKTTWRRPHRTYVAYDLYMPSPYSESMKRVLVAPDTSGSITDEMIGVAVSYIQSLVNEVNPNGVDIAWWDTEVAHVDRFERDGMYALEHQLHPAGGGGTKPSCITKWLDDEMARDNYACAIVITDGEFFSPNVGDWADLPVLWLVINKDDVPPINVGTVVHVREL